MYWIRLCIVHFILVTWNDWTAVIICRFFSESNDCWCGNKTTTKKHLKLTFYPNIWKEILTNQIQKNLYQTISQEASLPKKSIQKKSLPTTLSREISTPKNQVVFDMKNCKNRNWWNLIKTRCFIRFHQFRFLPCFLLCFSRIFWWRCFFILFGRDFSSEVFFA